MLFYLPIALTALATTLYHVAQKAIAPGVHPMVSLVTRTPRRSWRVS